MKKILIFSMLIGLTGNVLAQDFRTWSAFHAGHKNSTMLSYAVAQRIKAAQKPAWIKAVERQVHQATPLHGISSQNILNNYVQNQLEPNIPPQQHQEIQSIKTIWQHALQKTSTPIRWFHVVAVSAEDIITLSPEEVTHVARVLSGATNEKLHVEEFEHYMVRVTVPGTQPIHLLFNCFFREIYVVHANTPLPGVPLEKIKTRFQK